MKMQDKVALVTGGNSGLGLSIALRYQAEGAKVAICGRDRRTLDEAASQLGADTVVVEADVTKMADLERLVAETASQLGKIDVLVANAGVALFGPVEEVDEETFDILVNTNFKGLFFTVQKALPQMNDDGTIILMASNTNNMGQPNCSVYSATKSAVRSLARTLSAELLERRIRVNAISPGPHTTPIFSKIGMEGKQLEQALKYMEDNVPVKRFGSPDEVASVAVLLGSDEAAFIVGEEITIDGGRTNLC